jgi:hypothetical protein
MQINIDGRSVTRVLAVAAATIGVGASAFFGGQATRMDDTAVASVKSEAVTKAVKAAKAEDAIVLNDRLTDAKHKAARHERKAVRKMRRETRKRERKRADKLAGEARSQGYGAGNSAGYSAGHTDGHAEGYSEGDADGYSEGLDDASSEPCSDDPEVTSLPYC